MVFTSDLIKEADFVCEVKLDGPEQVKEFNSLCCRTDGQFDVISGRHNVDGKSILGLFSLSLSRPVTVAATFVDAREKEKFVSGVQEFKS